MNVASWLYERAQRAGERGPKGPRIDAEIASQGGRTLAPPRERPMIRGHRPATTPIWLCARLRGSVWTRSERGTQ
jgi:hypothetical protein